MWGYVPFSVVECKRSEQALIQVIQEAFINGVLGGVEDCESKPR